MGLFRKGKTAIIAKFHRTGLVICSHFRNKKTLSYSRINTVCAGPGTERDLYLWFFEEMNVKLSLSSKQEKGYVYKMEEG